jgi:hypothetical protein
VRMITPNLIDPKARANEAPNGGAIMNGSPIDLTPFCARHERRKGRIVGIRQPPTQVQAQRILRRPAETAMDIAPGPSPQKGSSAAPRLDIRDGKRASRPLY